MKYLIVTFFLIYSISKAQETIINTNPKEVTVYLNSAKVTEIASVKLTKGKNEVRVINLPNNVSTNTYQVALANGATLLSITPTTNYLKEDDFSEEELALINKKEALALQIKYKEAENKVLSGELRLIEENRKIGNDDTGWSTEQLSKLAAYYSKRALEINKGLIVLQIDIKDLQEQIGKINAQLTETQSKKNSNRQELILEIEATASTTSSLKISYIVQNAGWQPFYDVRAKSTKQPLELITKGKIYQNTGKDWTDVAMSVSTYYPKANQDRPILNPFYIQAYEPQAGIKNKLKKEYGNISAVNSYQLRDDAVALEEVVVSEVIEQQFNVLYKLDYKQSVASTGKGQTVVLDKKTIEADYMYHTVPKLSEDVFLLANIKNWQSLNLLLTEANIYFEDSFIGKTTINPNYTKSEYPFSLGVDERIVVKRRLLDNLSTKKTLSSKKIDNFAYEIKIRNNSSQNIPVEILDHVPISQNNKVEVTVENIAGGDFDKYTGSVLWEENLNRGESKTLIFNYQIKYPKDMVLQYY